MGRRKSSIAGQFVAYRLEMLESPAWLALSDDARRLLQRLDVEHMRHGGSENGSLLCTYSDFVVAGVRRNAISAAIREAEALGFLEVGRKGYRSRAEFRAPSLYRLTYVNGRGKSAPATDDWRSVADAADARARVAATVPTPKSR